MGRPLTSTPTGTRRIRIGHVGGHSIHQLLSANTTPINCHTTPTAKAAIMPKRRATSAPRPMSPSEPIQQYSAANTPRSSGAPKRITIPKFSTWSSADIPASISRRAARSFRLSTPRHHRPPWRARRSRCSDNAAISIMSGAAMPVKYITCQENGTEM